MQPAPGAVPPPPPPMAAHQYQYQQAPPQQQPPPQPSPYMMMMQPQPQAQPPAMWATQAAAPQAAGVAVPHQQQSQPGEIRTLWIGDLQYWMDEAYINTCFAHTGEVSTSRICLFRFFLVF